MRAAVALALVAAASGPALAEDEPGRQPEFETERCEPPQGLSEDQLIQRASDHYDRGQILYEVGDYEGAIEEFVAGYCNRPHPTWYYNIGQTYERLTNFERAVAYFDRFLRESDETDPNYAKARIRVEVLKRQPARITILTDPPDAEVTLRAAGVVKARGVANGKDPLLVLRGAYELRIELPGYETASREIMTEIGQPQSYNFELTPKKGRVKVTADPTSARIFLDKTFVGVGSYTGDLPIGRYQLLVEARNRPQATRSLEITADKSLSLDVDLPAPARSGRWELIVASTIGLGAMSSAAFAEIFSDSLTAGLAGAGGLALGFGGAYLGVPSDVSVGTASYFTGAAMIGAAEVTLVSLFIGCRDEAVEDCDSQLAGGFIAGAMGGLLFAAVTQPRFRLDAGDAAAINSGAIWGSATGLLFYAIFDEDERIREPLVFAGLNLGIVAGATLASRYDLSRKRMALIDLAGVGGFVAGNALTRAIAGDDESVDHFSIAGVAAGLITGAYLTRNIDIEETHALQPTIRTTTDSAGKSTTTLGAQWGF